jgi:hypothetical protein
VGRGGEIRRGDPSSCCKGGGAVGKSAVGIRRSVREAASRALGGGEARVEVEAESEGRWWHRGGSRESGGGEAAAWWFGSERRVRYPWRR